MSEWLLHVLCPLIIQGRLLPILRDPLRLSYFTLHRTESGNLLAGEIATRTMFTKTFSTRTTNWDTLNDFRFPEVSFD